MSREIPTPEYVYNALLRANYFPMVKEHLDEIPPLFGTVDCTTDIMDELVGMAGRSSRGYDQVEYRATRFNNVTRVLQIPHPLPYAKLCKSIYDNWQHIQHICSTPESKIKPAVHTDDRIVTLGDYDDLEAARLIVMDGDSFPQDVEDTFRLTMSNRYVVSADISACFPSIYSHSIPWALVGHETAKQNRAPRFWYNRLDKCERELARGETHGIPIGPGTSNLIAEIVLSKIDLVLRGKGFKYTRYIDDYTCYCATKEKAEEFLVCLEKELRKYLLSINAKKVKIEELPIPQSNLWILELRQRLQNTESIAPRGVADYLDFALNLQKVYPEGSVMKYAARALLPKLQENSSAEIYTRYLSDLAFHFPVLLPLLCEVCKRFSSCRSIPDCSSLVKRHLRYERSDSVSWSIYLNAVCERNVAELPIDAILENFDCIPVATLVATGFYQLGNIAAVGQRLIEKCNNPKDEYMYDKYWLLIYEFTDGIDFFNDYKLLTGLSFLKEKGVGFVRPFQPI